MSVTCSQNFVCKFLIHVLHNFPIETIQLLVYRKKDIEFHEHGLTVVKVCFFYFNFYSKLQVQMYVATRLFLLRGFYIAMIFSVVKAYFTKHFVLVLIISQRVQINFSSSCWIPRLVIFRSINCGEEYKHKTIGRLLLLASDVQIFTRECITNKIHIKTLVTYCFKNFINHNFGLNFLFTLVLHFQFM